MRATRLTLLALLIVGMLIPLSGTASAQDAWAVAEEDAFVEAINATRAEQGLAGLIVNAQLQEVARGWTTNMADSQRLAHNPSYTQEYTGQWWRMAENVGYTSDRGSSAATVSHLHQAFLNSPGHRANILGEYNQFAVAAAYDAEGKLWVTVNFLDGAVPEQAPEEQAPDDRSRPQRGHFSRGV